MIVKELEIFYHRYLMVRSKNYIPKIPIIGKKRKETTKNKKTRYEMSLSVHDKDRNNIEMTFGLIKNFKRLLMRYERKLENYSSLCFLACSIIILKRIKN